MAGGWDNIGHSSNSTERGVVNLPPAKAMCAKCNRRRLVSDMQVETNERSGAFSFLVCSEPWQHGGCYEGPYPDDSKPAQSEDIGPIPNIFYS